MSTPASTADGAAPGRADDSSGVNPWRRFLAIDERENFIAWSQTLTGRLLIYLTAIVAVATYFPWWESALVVSAAMAAAYAPNFRNPILFTATWVAAFLEMGLAENRILRDIGIVLQQEQVTNVAPIALAAAFLLLVMVGAWASLDFVRRRPKSFLARRPLVTLLAVEVLLFSLTTLDVMQGLPRVVLWSMLVVLTPYVWFLPYAIVDQRARDASPPLLQLAVLRPFWSPSYLPFGKGAAFLRKKLSKTPRDVAITQLKAVKLLLWSNALLAVKTAMAWLFVEQMQIPSVELALDAFLGSQPYPITVGWSALILSTANYALKIAMWTGLFIGIARLAAYRLPRGCWRPLESRTLMDYFNRFHYYFKELLVDFFFVPTFFTMFRKHPRLRMFFATFMAAGVGNAIWHFTWEIHLLATMGLAGAVETYTSYLFYCVVLATGIGISQVRANLGIRPSSTFFGRCYSFLFVWSFVVCLHVFGDESRNHTLGERLSFLASLFGVS
ncbi:hypothetical protein [Accumulibacter sp.]|uniref:hypothetical protein n=1 Tax=Accumulibacter sp. TaxID=2053492 RepID=UPI0028C3CA48|nr:hypothetical protein [Accumulibacter sp.]